MSTRPTVFHGSEAYAARRLASGGPGPVVTIGNFDGVHRGHRALLGRTLEQAADLGAPSCAFTFSPAPRDVLRPGNPVVRIQRLADKLRSLGAAGLDQAVVEPFTLAYGAHDAEWFARRVLAERLAARAVVVGWDFRFGRGRGGGYAELQRWLDVPVEQVAAHQEAGDVVSSSRIRHAVQSGAIEVAAELLGRPHELVGPVRHGQARGRDLGFRTANVVVQTPLVPPPGVYAVQVAVEPADPTGGERLPETEDLPPAPVDTTWLPAIANFGTRPTFDGAPADAPVLEAHLFDFVGDLYDRQLRVGLVARLRDERRFDSPEALVHQIRLDIAAARAALGLPARA